MLHSKPGSARSIFVDHSLIVSPPVPAGTRPYAVGVASRSLRRVVVFAVVVTLLVSLSIAFDPVFGQPDTRCTVRSPQLLSMWDYLPDCR